MIKKVGAILGIAGIVFMASPAHADNTTGHGGVLSGNQITAPITAPINVCGVSAGVLGVAVSGCEGGAGAVVKH